MRIAWYSPLPPIPSGISDYTVELVPYIAEKAEVDVFCPRLGMFRKPRAPKGARHVEPPEYLPWRYDGTFYHLGNNPHHEYVYQVARRRPEIDVFHDGVLHHLIADITIERGGDPGRYERILHGEYGERGTQLAVLRRSGIATDFEKFLYPLTAHVAQQAKGIVVHSRDAAERMREAAPDVPLVVIPHHAGETPERVAGMSREEARDRLTIAQDALVIGHFGFITRPKQPAAVIGGFGMLHREFPEAILLMVGADHTGGALGRMVDRLGLGRAVKMVGYVDIERFYVFLKACDAVINLRYPTAGESSGTLARSLAEGRVLLVNNYASWAELPEDVALKVEIDRPQTEQVGQHLLRIARDPALRARMEENARRYALERLDPRKCGDQYLAFAREVGSKEETPSMILPERDRRRPLTYTETQALHQRLKPRIDDVAGATLSQDGIATYIDLAYRLLLRRPAEPEAIRHGHAEFAFGASLTRAGLVKRIVESPEFAEVVQIEAAVRELGRGAGPFTLQPDDRYAPGTTERAVEIPWVLSRYNGERRVLDLGYAFASGVYLSALLDLGIRELHGTDLAAASVPGMRRTRADLRALPYRDESFDLIVCISTLEHVGFDNTRYGMPYQDKDAGGQWSTLQEIARVLAPHGRVLISIPFGRREERGWMFQHDHETWTALLRESPFRVEEQQTFRQEPHGWERVMDARSMGLVSYADGVPAAKGLLCAVLANR
jgi:glycosyltransferase involved in cell wall biosynthesis/SAM-dependent methyltransferase